MKANIFLLQHLIGQKFTRISNINGCFFFISSQHPDLIDFDQINYVFSTVFELLLFLLDVTLLNFLVLAKIDYYYYEWIETVNDHLTSCNLSSIPVAPKRIRFCSIFSATCATNSFRLLIAVDASRYSTSHCYSFETVDSKRKNILFFISTSYSSLVKTR